MSFFSSNNDLGPRTNYDPFHRHLYRQSVEESELIGWVNRVMVAQDGLIGCVDCNGRSRWVDRVY